MRVLIIDHILLEGATLAQRLVKDGHEVVLSGIWGRQGDSPVSRFLGNGLAGVKIDPDGWMRWLKWADVATVTGIEHQGKIVSYLREQGVPVAAPGPWACSLELDRTVGQTVAREAGLLTPWQKEFANPDEVVAFIEKNPRRYVLKVDQNLRAYIETFVPDEDDSADMVQRLKSLSGRIPDTKNGFHLQEFIEGVEVAVGGWFNGDQILGDLYVSFDGDFGFCYDLRYTGDGFLDRAKLEAVLKKGKLRGPFDINGMVVDGKFYYLEWTMRWGCGMTDFFCHATEDLGELLRGVATGGPGVPVRAELMGKMATSILLRYDDDDCDEASLTVGLPEGESLPVIKPDVSFFVTWPGKSPDGKWMSLPVLPTKRRGMYVAVADTLEECLRKVDIMSDSYYIPQGAVEVARARKELAKRVGIMWQAHLGEGWIRDVALEQRLKMPGIPVFPR